MTTPYSLSAESRRVGGEAGLNLYGPDVSGVFSRFQNERAEIVESVKHCFLKNNDCYFNLLFLPDYKKCKSNFHREGYEEQFRHSSSSMGWKTIKPLFLISGKVFQKFLCDMHTVY